MSHSVDLCELFAEHVAGSRFEQLPGAAVEGAKKTLLDTLGVMLAGGGMEPSVRRVVEHVKAGGGAPECSVLGFGLRVPAEAAAFANGAMAHALDYDDQTPWGQHAASSLVPAALAAAQRRRGVPGRELITAVAVGQDLFNRLRRHVEWQKDWNFSTVIGVFSATAAAGRALGLSADAVARAFGIASLQSGGSTAVINSTGSDLRGLYAAFSARGAVTAALLARQGIGGVTGLFEGPYGVFDLFFGGRYDRAALLDGLGQDFTGGLTLYKRWPAVGTAHGHLHATIGLVEAHAIDPAQIEQIRLFVGDYHRLMCEPLEQRRAPGALVEAKFSLPWLVAAVAIQRDLRLADFRAEALRDPQVLALAQRVVPVADATLDWKEDLPSGRVEIVLHDGRRFERLAHDIPGSVDAPLDWAALERKFLDCAAMAARPLPPDRLAAAVHTLRHLESVDDAGAALRALG
ncbi:MAG: MmgE/PrpD family protein [Piscinibacter sp.]|uniref:MmgE/PrpD family protein n=1 Tax=Piscinibacter TaxID=1114981 RepID=UPI000FDD3DCF|nr:MULTISPECIES: MmgE/PrpD family protein [Piscinibacter]MCW5666245.1 MmgE/PrpD family protein [Piscinibacter sp.]